MTISSLNIIVPLKNEEKGIDNLIQNLTPILQKIQKKTKISLIGYHSTDQTLKILKKYEQQFNFVKVYENEKNIYNRCMWLFRF